MDPILSFDFPASQVKVILTALQHLGECVAQAGASMQEQANEQLAEYQAQYRDTPMAAQQEQLQPFPEARSDVADVHDKF